MLWGIDEFVLCLMVAAGLAVAVEASYRIGHARSDTASPEDSAHVSTLQSAVLGLLALLLGFSFAMAVSRYDARKARVVEEANAIGTTALRAQLLPATEGAAVRRMLEEYVAARLAYHDAGVDAARVAVADAAAARLESAIWARAREVAAADPHAITTGAFITSLNEMLDARERRRAAMDDRVPEAVIWVLLANSAAALGLVGYGCGMARRRRWRSNALVAVLIAVVFTLIVDLDRPRRGLVKVGQESLLRLKAGLASGTP